MTLLRLLRGARSGRHEGPAVAKPDPFAVALDEARRALDQQHEDLEALRGRAGNLLQYGGLVAAFFGALTLRGTAQLTVWTYAGAAAFVVVTGLVMVVLWPRTYTFSNDATVMLDEWQLAEREAADVTAHLARYLANHHRENEKTIRLLTWSYTVGIVVLAIEILCLTTDLVRR